jgi:hypothetical protein
MVTGRAPGSSNRLGRGAVDVRGEDRGSLRGESPGDRRADTGAGSGDQRGAAREASVWRVFVAHRIHPPPITY